MKLGIGFTQDAAVSSPLVVYIELAVPHMLYA